MTDMTGKTELVRQLLALLSDTSDTNKKPVERPVLVTTAHRGVFMGWASDTSGSTIHMTKARMVVYWSPAMRGVLGLATKGPDSDCRISPAAELDLRDVTAVAEIDPGCLAKWDAFPWATTL